MLELFHVIADPGSAAARKLVVQRRLEDQVRFRNLHYPEVRADFQARGGTTPPALWDGKLLLQGPEQVLARLGALRTSTPT